MSIASFTSNSLPPTLSDEEAVTLRRVAFGESVTRSLRPADLVKLAKLGLIVQSAGTHKLTVAGKKHVDGLPRALFARPRRGTDF